MSTTKSFPSLAGDNSPKNISPQLLAPKEASPDSKPSTSECQGGDNQSVETSGIVPSFPKVTSSVLLTYDIVESRDEDVQQEVSLTSAAIATGNLTFQLGQDPVEAEGDESEAEGDKLKAEVPKLKTVAEPSSFNSTEIAPANNIREHTGATITKPQADNTLASDEYKNQDLYLYISSATTSIDRCMVLEESEISSSPQPRAKAQCFAGDTSISVKISKLTKNEPFPVLKRCIIIRDFLEIRAYILPNVQDELTPWHCLYIVGVLKGCTARNIDDGVIKCKVCTSTAVRWGRERLSGLPWTHSRTHTEKEFTTSNINYVCRIVKAKEINYSDRDLHINLNLKLYPQNSDLLFSTKAVKIDV